MGKAKFTLLARVASQFIPVTIKKNIPYAPDGAGSYYVRYSDPETSKRITAALGKDLASAYAEMRSMERARFEQERGLPPSQVDLVPAGSLRAAHNNGGSKDLVSEKIEAFLANAKGGTVASSQVQYANSMRVLREGLAAFAKSNKLPAITRVCEITRPVMIGYREWLETDARSNRKKQFGFNTRFMHFNIAIMFLKFCGIDPRNDMNITKKCWPPKDDRAPEEYRDDQLNTLLAMATAEESLVLRSFLCSGVRNKELANMTYGDVDFEDSCFRIRMKRRGNIVWRGKSEKAHREIPVPRDLSQEIWARMTDGGHTSDELIFPNEEGNLQKHLLKMMKDLAKRAGVKGRVDCHKFRSTYATRQLQSGVPIRTVMQYLGHSSLDMLARYEAKLNVRDSKMHAQATAAFEQFSGQPKPFVLKKSA